MVIRSVGQGFPDVDGVEHRFLDVHGLRMHVAMAGAGEPMLLLHGFPGSWWSWRHVIGPLAERDLVVVPDLRGTGRTDAPDAGYGRSSLIGDAVGLLDALGLERVHLVGHDWGALVAFGLALDAPERVRSVLSLATPHPYARLSAGMAAQMWRLWFQEVVAAPGIGPLALRTRRQRLLRHLLLGYAKRREAWTEEDLALLLGPLREPARARAASALYRRFILPEAMRIIAGAYRDRPLGVPAVVAGGAADPLAQPELLGGWEGHAADLRLESVPGAAHHLPEERPDAVVALALELAGRASGSR